LLTGEVDFIVHSYKDLPTAPHPDLVVAAIPPRADARDALVCLNHTSLRRLPPGTRVGTGAPRRMAQLRSLGLDLEVIPLRGNVDSRLRKLTEHNSVDALILAAAGLQRLGQLDAVRELIDPSLLLPAPAQGALAIECRADDNALRSLLGSLDHHGTRLGVIAERAFLAALEGGCTAPIGALATLGHYQGVPGLRLEGVITAPDGGATVRAAVVGHPSAPVKLAQTLAVQLLRACPPDILQFLGRES
jgi:hydroxymethylbilane synthase